MGMELLNALLPLMITICGSGGILTVIFTIKANKKMDAGKAAQEASQKATEAQTLQNTLVGRLRRAQERLEKKQRNEYQGFIKVLAAAYWRGNDKQTVKEMSDALEKKTQTLDDSIDELTEVLNEVYAGKLLDETEIERAIKAAERRS